MRITVLVPSLFDALGGIQTYSQSFTKCLDELAGRFGWKIVVLALNDKPGNELPGYYDPANTKYLAFSRQKVRFTMQSLRYARNSDMIVMLHLNFVPLACAFRRIASNANSVVILHGIEAWQRLRRTAFMGISCVDQIWSVSDFTRKQLLATNPIDTSKIRFAIVPCTLGPFYEKTASLPISRKELGLPSGRMILSVSRINLNELYKNVDLTIQSMSAVLAQVPDAFLVVVGPGEDRARLEQIAVDRGVREKVIFAGQVSDDHLASYFRECDLFVLPSTKEGFGIVYLEAMYFSKACIGASSGGVTEVIEDGVTGMLVNAHDPPAIPNAIVRLLTDDRLREGMAQAGRDRLDRLFSIDAFRQRLQDLVTSSVTPSARTR